MPSSWIHFAPATNLDDAYRIHWRHPANANTAFLFAVSTHRIKKTHTNAGEEKKEHFSFKVKLFCKYCLMCGYWNWLSGLCVYFRLLIWLQLVIHHMTNIIPTPRWGFFSLVFFLFCSLECHSTKFLIRSTSYSKCYFLRTWIMDTHAVVDFFDIQLLLLSSEFDVFYFDQYETRLLGLFQYFLFWAEYYQYNELVISSEHLVTIWKKKNWLLVLNVHSSLWQPEYKDVNSTISCSVY